MFDKPKSNKYENYENVINVKFQAKYVKSKYISHTSCITIWAAIVETLRDIVSNLSYYMRFTGSINYTGLCFIKQC